MAGELYNKIIELVDCPAYALQLYKTSECREVDDVIAVVIDDVLELFAGDCCFFVMGHSFGTILALRIAHILESQGKRGQVVFLDGSPDSVGKMANQMICDTVTDETLRERILKDFIALTFSKTADEVTSRVFQESSWDERIRVAHKFMDNENFSVDYVKQILLTGMFNRLKMSLKIDALRVTPLKAKATLIKSDEFVSPDGDYGLVKYFEHKLNICEVGVGHISLLTYPDLPKIVESLILAEQPN